MARNENLSLLNSFDWSKTSLGGRQAWPLELRMIVRTTMKSGFPICAVLGDDGIQIYNDAYNPIYGHKHPASFGAPARESWPEIWEFLGPALDKVRSQREAMWFTNTLLPLNRKGQQEECYFDFSYSPIIDGKGSVIGVLSVADEKTAEVVALRRRGIDALGQQNSEDLDFEKLAKDLYDVLKENSMDCASAVFFDADRYTANPTVCRWSLRCDNELAAELRPLIAHRSNESGLSRIALRTDALDERQARYGIVINLYDRQLQIRGVLVLIPHKLVLADSGIMDFAARLADRFHAMLHYAEKWQARLGKIRDEAAEPRALSELLFENMSEAAFYASAGRHPDDEEIVLAANPSAKRLFGYGDEIVGLNRQAFVQKDEPALKALLKSRATSESAVAELMLRRKDGTEFPAEFSSSLFTLPGDEVRSISIIRDLTQRREIEKERAERVRLQTIANVSGGLAHDFNNLLTVILGSLEQLNHDSDINEHSRQSVADAIFAAESAGDLTSQLLTYAGRQTLDVSVVDLNAFIRHRAGLFRSSLGEINELQLELGDQPLPCMADAAQLTTAILNLVINAKDAMPNGGRLVMRTYYAGASSLPDAGDGYLLDMDSCLVLSVADTGEGIPASTLPRIFEPFFSTKDSSRSTGLGLSMVQGFMRSAGGDVRVTSAPGEGTRFDLIFRAASRAELLQEKTHREGDLQRRTVLYVEDNDLVRDQTVPMLLRAGMTPLIAANAKEAQAIVNSGQTFDMVLTDLVMPGSQSGLQLADQLAAQYPDIPIIVTTGYDRGAELARKEPGKYGLLRKPYRFEQLKNALSERL